MLSVCIPVFNFNVTELVQALNAQAAQLGIAYEIRVYDDGSSERWKASNRALQNAGNVVYNELAQNVGRSAIRNRLASEAQFEQLLFMDCDSRVTKADYVARYVQAAKPERVVCGGRTYTAQPPEEAEQFLRWHYGCEREVMAAAERSAHPYQSFMTNNFLVPKAIFQGIGLDERLTGYGHEDTLFGCELRKAGIEVLHIDNPLDHIGLETAAVFLEKTREGVRNLAFLHRNGALGNEVKLLRYYRKLKRFGVHGFTRRRLARRMPAIEQNLLSARPDLRMFDLYKLHWLLHELKNG